MKVIDFHAHVWLSRADDDRRELAEAAEAIPLERLCTSGLCGELPQPGAVRAANDAVAVLMRDCPRVAGFAYLNPRHGDRALEELRHRVDQGFAGIKLWIATRADDELNFPVYEAAIDLKLPVLYHCFAKTVGQKQFETGPAQMAAAARRYPECSFVMAHIAGDFIAGSDAVADLPNVCVDISGSYGEKGMVEYAVGKLGASRVLFGTDMPASDFYHNLGKVTGAGVPDEIKSLVLCGNAERLLRCPTG